MTPDGPQDPDDNKKKPPQPEDPAAPAGGELWRLLQDEGSLSELGEPDEYRSYNQPPQPSEPRQLSPEEELDAWRNTPRSTEDSSVEASRIRRVIEGGEDAGEDLQYRAVAPVTAPPPSATSDYDPAVGHYLHNDSSGVACKNHPDRDSVSQCPECQAYYCQECMTIRRGRMLCRDCAEATFVASEDDIIRAQEQGLDAPEADVTLEAPPEFQLGGIGIEGAPAHPLKQLVAWLLDLAVSRGLLLGVLFVLDMLGLVGFAEPLFAPEGEPFTTRVLNHLILLQPLPAWLLIVAGWDFLYYFITQALFNRTLGMSWTGCRIVTEWGDYVPFGGVAIRTVVFVACLELPAILATLFFRGYRGPHDLAAGTMTINYAGIKRVDAYETVQIRL
jgi:uncharacterized RDD family membrane protein YckC